MLKHILQIKFFRNMLLLSLIIALAFPLIDTFLIYPAFTNLVIVSSERNAERLAQHLSSHLRLEQIGLEGGFDAEGLKIIRETADDFQLAKLKIFNGSGEIIYSTSEEEVGEVNRNDYFHQVVSWGKTYTVVVRKDGVSLENKVITADVVETYVPLLYDGKFIGAFEIYYDITRTRQELSNLVTHSVTLLFSVGLGLLLVIVLVVLRAGKAELALREEEERYRYLSFHDAMTNLFNRRYYDNELTRLNDNWSEVKPVSILAVDLNGLKIINDILGHSHGDQLIQIAGQLISLPFNKGGVLARIGGDEFSIIMPKTDFQVALKKKEEILRLEEEHNNRQPFLPLSLSIGVANSDEPTLATIYDVHQKADDRMYEFKASKALKADDRIVDLLLRTLGDKDFVAQGHIDRLYQMAVQMAEAMLLSREDREGLMLLAKLHDIGKIFISREILLKEGKLVEQEFLKIKQHPELGYGIANRCQPFNRIALLILHHHELWNGSGYPAGLKEEKIPLLARVFSILDAYDAMTSDRPYRRALSREEALAEIRRGSKVYYDPDLVQIFLKGRFGAGIERE